jgi:uncharacterized ion transporter superfamily protein YfcC
MWLSAIKLAVSAGSKIYANKQKTKIAMSDAQLMHASKMAEGKEAYQGKLLEARQSDWKDEAVLLILSAPIAVLAWAVVSDDPTAMEKVNIFFDHFSSLPSWFTNLWILVVANLWYKRN